MFEVNRLSASEFSCAFADLDCFGNNPDDQLVIQNGILQRQRSCFASKLFKPKNERLHFVANFAMEFFSSHVDFLQGKQESLLKFKTVFDKAKCPEKFDLLMQRVEAYKSIHSVFIPEIVSKVLTHLSVREIAQSMKVCRSFKDAVQNSRYLSSKIMQAKLLNEAVETRKLAEIEYRSIDSSHIAVLLGEQAKVDLTGALTTARKMSWWIEVPGAAFVKIVAAQANDDLEGAIVTASEVKGSPLEWNSTKRWRERALTETVQEYAKVDREKAYALATSLGGFEPMHRYIMGLADVALDEAITLSQKIEDHDNRSKALLSVLSVLVKRDLDEARKLIKFFDGYIMKRNALSLIACEEAKTDPDQALITAQGFYPNDRAHSVIIAEIAKDDLPRALAMARELTDRELLAKCLVKIAEVIEDAEISMIAEILNEAIETTERCHYFQKNELFMRIAIAISRYDLRAGLAMARRIQDTRGRASALANIAKNIKPERKNRSFLVHTSPDSFRISAGND